MHIEKATPFVNLYIFVYLLAGIGGGLLADRIGAKRLSVFRLESSNVHHRLSRTGQRGNYLVSGLGSIIWCVGGAILGASSACNGINRTSTNARLSTVLPKAPPLDMPTLFGGIFLSAVGYGFIFPTQIVFVGSQFDPLTESEWAATAVAYWYSANNIGDFSGEVRGRMSEGCTFADKRAQFAGPLLRQTFGGQTALVAIAGATMAGAAVFLVGTPLYRNAVHAAPPPTSETQATPSSPAAPATETTLLLNKVHAPTTAAARADAVPQEATELVKTSPSLPFNKLQLLLIATPIPIFYVCVFCASLFFARCTCSAPLRSASTINKIQRSSIRASC